MVRTHIEGAIQVAPLPDGGKLLAVKAGPNHEYVIALTPEILKGLALDADGLAKESARQQAASKIVVPGLGAPLSNGNARA